MKSIRHEISKPLAFVINESFEQATFPTSLKLAKLQPLYKSGEKSQFVNYRPISQLSCVSKTIEKTAIAQLDSYLEDNDIVSKNQFGFRASHSTIHPILATVTAIEQALDRKEYVALVAIDLQKAFDTVPSTEILPEKLQYYGCDASSTAWFRSFFEGRKQYVTVNNTSSTTISMEDISVVQGSTMGPKCFSVDFNDISVATKSLAILFADDTNLILSNKCPKTLENELNDDLNSLSDFLAANKLSLNAKKTVFMLLKPRKSCSADVQLRIADKPIEEVDNLKFLGVHFNHQMSWDCHADHVANKMKQGIMALIGVKNVLNYSCKLKIYNALIKSHLEYAISAWYPKLRVAQKQFLGKLQKKAIRLVWNANYNEHTNILFSTSNTLPIEEIYRLQVLTLTYNLMDLGKPKYFQQFLGTNFSQRRNDHFRVAISNELSPTCTLYRHFALWNDLPQEQRTATTIARAKFLFRQDFYTKNTYQCKKPNCYSCQNRNIHIQQLLLTKMA